MGRWLPILLVLTLAGCSPDAHRRSADLQVESLLRDRKQQTLGYQPQTEVIDPAEPKPAKQAYQKIPASPVVPPTTSPVEPQLEGLPDGPLGPELFWMTSAPEAIEPAEIDALRRAGPAPLGPTAPDQQPQHFDLFDCIRYAVQNSRTYQDEMEDLYLAGLEVTVQRHMFDLRPTLTESLGYSGVKPPGSTLDQPDQSFRSSWNSRTAAGLRQRFGNGAEIAATSAFTFIQALSEQVQDGESAELVLSGSIPLLRGAGLVNLEGLISSERNVVYQVRAFEDFRRSFVVDIASRYFRLLAQQQGVMNRRLNLASLQNLTDRSRALFKADRINFIEVQRALQSQLQAESDLINSESDYAAALDDFKLAIGMPVDQQLDVAAIALDVDIPRVNADDAVQLAYQYRLSLRTASDRIEDAQRAVANARNGLLPDLDLSAQARNTNEPDAQAFSVEDRTTEYSAGVTLDLPVDRVSERNSYRRALISLQRAQRSFITARESVATTVREDLRGIRSAEINLEIQRRGIDLAQRRLDNANELFKLGRAGNRDVVEAQNALLSAQDSYERARGELQIRVLQYMRDTGTLRVDPAAGSIGRAMDRKPTRSTKADTRG